MWQAAWRALEPVLPLRGRGLPIWPRRPLTSLTAFSRFCFLRISSPCSPLCRNGADVVGASVVSASRSTKGRRVVGAHALRRRLSIPLFVRSSSFWFRSLIGVTPFVSVRTVRSEADRRKPRARSGSFPCGACRGRVSQECVPSVSFRIAVPACAHGRTFARSVMKSPPDTVLWTRPAPPPHAASHCGGHSALNVQWRSLTGLRRWAKLGRNLTDRVRHLVAVRIRVDGFDEGNQGCRGVALCCAPGLAPMHLQFGHVFDFEVVWGRFSGSCPRFLGSRCTAIGGHGAPRVGLGLASAWGWMRRHARYGFPVFRGAGSGLPCSIPGLGSCGSWWLPGLRPSCRVPVALRHGPVRDVLVRGPAGFVGRGPVAFMRPGAGSGLWD